MTSMSLWIVEVTNGAIALIFTQRGVQLGLFITCTLVCDTHSSLIRTLTFMSSLPCLGSQWQVSSSFTVASR